MLDANFHRTTSGKIQRGAFKREYEQGKYTIASEALLRKESSPVDYCLVWQPMPQGSAGEAACSEDPMYVFVPETTSANATSHELTFFTDESLRGSLLSFANTDMAFSGDMLVTGNYHGFNAYRLGEDGVPNLVTSVVCPGGQGDLSVHKNILVMSVDSSRSDDSCSSTALSATEKSAWEGLRVFDVSNPRKPGAQIRTH